MEDKKDKIKKGAAVMGQVCGIGKRRFGKKEYDCTTHLYGR